MSRHSFSPCTKIEDLHRVQTPYSQYKSGDVIAQDSDTDSGICADSDHTSTKQRLQIPVIFSDIKSTDYLNQRSHRPLTSLEASLRQQAVTRNPEATRNPKPYRVRFADESNGSIKQPMNCEFIILQLQHLVSGQHFELRKNGGFRESIRDSVIRQNVNEALNWKLHNRSSSLPRMEEYIITEFCHKPTRCVNYQGINGGSLEKLDFDSDPFPNPNSNTLRLRKLPVVPVLHSLKLSESQHEDAELSNQISFFAQQ
ncbi:hypothetical protein KIN20_036713 [Parelaphostrongylus tenuis]|uniref:Uncharacterized protein n=1 Tax=Parelaphostrongylus tenuis TaxID=148309 RepID=A0AAD5RCX9_PARTN|nr:hypothetical protein KIN20_036713 [Parelaphostrongylus tenuis]